MSDHVTFEIAKKLKEKGFNIPSYFYYRTDDKFLHNAVVGKPLVYNDKIDDEVIIAPTTTQVLKWLRKEKKISIEPGIHCSLKWVCGIYGFNDGIDDFTPYSNDVINDTVCILYDSYEQAALAGIEYVLDNLI